MPVCHKSTQKYHHEKTFIMPALGRQRKAALPEFQSSHCCTVRACLKKGGGWEEEEGGEEGFHERTSCNKRLNRRDTFSLTVFKLRALISLRLQTQTWAVAATHAISSYPLDLASTIAGVNNMCVMYIYM